MKFFALVTLLFVFSGCSLDTSIEQQEPEDKTLVDDTNGSTTDDTTTVTDPVNYAPLNPIVCRGLVELDFKAVIENSSDAVEAEKLKLTDKNYLNSNYWSSNQSGDAAVVKLEDGAYITDVLISWLDPDVTHYYEIHVSDDMVEWFPIVVSGSSDPESLIATRVAFAQYAAGPQTARFVRLTMMGNEHNDINQLIEFQVFGCQQTVNHNIELIDWYLSVPTDTNDNGKSDSIYEKDLVDDYFDPRFFYLSKEGGLVFKTNVRGFKTSTNTKYIRTELREMLRRGNTSHKTQGVNKNNWVFSSAPQSDLDNAGAIDGSLRTTLQVDHVTTTGEDYQIGRVIIGQIHANDDEPIRLYYRKLPNNSKGSLYFAHEVAGGDEDYYELLGSRDNNASNPSDGIELGEKFTYEIHVVGHSLVANIIQNDQVIATNSVNMKNSGYDLGGQYMYFKAGVYNQNNSGHSHDYAQVTIYELENTHN